MHRLFLLLALSAAGLGLWVLFASPETDLSATGLPVAAGDRDVYGGWAMGLLMGLALAWAAVLDWRTLPERLTAWVRLQRRRLALLVLGGICASVLLLL
jgi:hypothetical protein